MPCRHAALFHALFELLANVGRKVLHARNAALSAHPRRGRGGLFEQLDRLVVAVARERGDDVGEVVDATGNEVLARLGGFGALRLVFGFVFGGRRQRRALRVGPRSDLEHRHVSLTKGRIGSLRVRGEVLGLFEHPRTHVETAHVRTS